MFGSRFRSRMPSSAQPTPEQPAQPAAQATPQPSPAPTQQAQAPKPAQGPQLSDAIALLKTGDRAGAEALMRQIVGLPALPVQGQQPPGDGTIGVDYFGPGGRARPTPGQPGIRPPVMPAPVTQPPGLVNRTIVMGPAPGQSYQDYMDNRMKSYDPYAIGKNR
jgi:hypothetical protein